MCISFIFIFYLLTNDITLFQVTYSMFNQYLILIKKVYYSLKMILFFSYNQNSTIIDFDANNLSYRICEIILLFN